MDSNHYLNIFQKAATQLHTQVINKQGIEVATGLILESVFLKLYKKTWSNPSRDPITSESRIFFSVWINDQAIKESKILYNIHALKLRQLKGYSIASREFASSFRKGFKKYERQWPNMSIDFGPQTLMEGWVKLNADSLQDDILDLANRFLEIEHLIDDLLKEFKSSK